jgi:hypothetical protein
LLYSSDFTVSFPATYRMNLPNLSFVFGLSSDSRAAFVRSPVTPLSRSSLRKIVLKYMARISSLYFWDAIYRSTSTVSDLTDSSYRVLITRSLKSSTIYGCFIIPEMRSTPNILASATNLGSYKTFFKRITAASCVYLSVKSLERNCTPSFSTDLSFKISVTRDDVYTLSLSLIGEAGLT